MDNLTEEKLNILFDTIDRLIADKGQVLMAIDGPCTAGKTTLSGILKQRYLCNVVHMDEFFLRPEQRTAERLAEPGGNVDYERFHREVLCPLQTGHTFSYRPFSCQTQELAEPITVQPGPLTVIEGSYSLHPYFREPYHLKVFLSIDPQIQSQRIALRPKEKQARFFQQWIPMEQRYFSHFSIPSSCDLIL